MGKQIAIALFAFLLLAPQSETQARGRHHEVRDSNHAEEGRHHRRHHRRHRRGSNGTRAQLAFLNQAVSDINAEIDILKLQVGGLPVDLSTTLSALHPTGG